MLDHFLTSPLFRNTCILLISLASHLAAQYYCKGVTVATHLLSLLLLMSGNVEEDPGPGGDGEGV